MREKILLIAALHGDEDFSIDVLQEVEKEYHKEKYNYDWIIGNPEALKQNVRFTEVDLNRVAPGEPTSNIYEERQAAKIIKLSKNYSAIIDIHGTDAKSGIFTLITNPTIENLMLAASLPVKNNVIWASKSSLKKGPITQFVHPPAVEIECGPKNDILVQNELRKVIEDILISRDISLPNLLKRAKEKQFFTVYGKTENIDTSSFREFELAELEGEEFYPLLIDAYKTGSLRKMKKLNLFDIVGY